MIPCERRSELGPSSKRRKLHHSFSMTQDMDEQGLDGFTGANPEQTHYDHTADEDLAEEQEEVMTSSREELMDCIKKGKRSRWVPTAGFRALRAEEDAKYALLDTTMTRTPSPSGSQPPNSACLSQQDKQNSDGPVEPYERPPSALHRGNFAEETKTAMLQDFWLAPKLTTSEPVDGRLDALEPSPWPASEPQSHQTRNAHHSRAASDLQAEVKARRRAPSLGTSLSSSFMLRAPTSPLVQTMSSLDNSQFHRADQLSTMGGRDPSRRRTMPPSSFQNPSEFLLDSSVPNFSRTGNPSLRREASLPSSGFSVPGLTYHPRSNPQTSTTSSRRSSIALGPRSRRRTSMIGSFEESILRGTMSTPPSHPLDFVAEIGVMGKAVFYDYSTSPNHRTLLDDAPSPYVGTIDLHHNLTAVVLCTKKSKVPRDSTGSNDQSHTETDVNKSSDTTKIRIGGAYRVPKQGQLQIIVKNPNKTAVKLFLVPYDLDGIQPGQRTFVRQRSYSSGPILEVPATDGGTPITNDSLANKAILRYLVHIKFCCPAKNRFYLYDDIRVVFANRVPEGKERLKNEIQLPDPKFMSWKIPQSNPDPPSELQILGSALRKTASDDPKFDRVFDDFEHEGREVPASPSPPYLPPSNFDFSNGRQHTIAPRAEFATWREQRPSSSTSMKKEFVLPDITQPVSSSSFTSDTPVNPVHGFDLSTSKRNSPLPWSKEKLSIRRTPSPSQAGKGLLSRQLKAFSSPADTHETDAENIDRQER